MSKKENQDMVVDFTPLEKIEALYSELTDWYGEADKKELRVAAKLLMVSLEKFSIFSKTIRNSFKKSCDPIVVN